MKKIGFIGAYDKMDLIIFISKLLVQNGLKVLIVDATVLQKTRYTLPCIAPSKFYMTTYEDIDIAIGFETLNDIKTYSNVEEFNYDIMFFDIDTKIRFEKFEADTLDINYFVTAFDNYSIKKGLAIIGKEREIVSMTKVLFSANMSKEENEYLNALSLQYSIKWTKEKIYFPFESGDNSVIIENQRNSRISFKELSLDYKVGLLEITGQIAPELQKNDIKKMLKNI